MAVVNGSLQSFKTEMRGEMEDQFRSFKGEMNGQFGAFKTEVKAEMKGLEAKMGAGFRGQGVLLEKMQGNIDTLVEGQELLHDRADRIDVRMGHIEDKLDRVEVKLDILWVEARAN